MNYFYYHPIYIEIQKIEDLCYNFIIINLLFVLCMTLIEWYIKILLVLIKEIY